MERYSEYKSTDIGWLPFMPKHWKLESLRKFLRMVSVKNHPNMPLLSVTRENGVIVRNVDSKEENHNFIPEDLSGYKYVEKGDFCINKMKSWQGSYGVSEYEGIVSPAYYICKLFGVDRKFFSMAIRSRCYVSFFAQYSKGIRVDQWDLSPLALKAIPFFLPPLSEQQAIVSYLDIKCSKLDTLVENKEKEISLLSEMKQRVIADAVTRGLNPSVKLKATNITWLPEIPEHWEEKRLFSKFVGDVDANKDFVYKHAFKFNYGELVPKNEMGNSEEYRETYVKYSLIKKGDILINGLNLNYDFVSQRVACAPNDGIITSAYLVCRPRKGVYYNYYTYLFKAMDGMKLFHGMGAGIRLTLSFKELKKQMLPVPPLSEQQAIVSYITERTAKIDSLIEKLNKEIECIKEYKQRLISDVVTGQIKVS